MSGNEALLAPAEVLYIRDGDVANVLKIEAYPDGMPLVKRGPSTTPRILLRPRSLGSFTAAMYWCDAMAEKGHPIPELILPNVPGSRQDRSNPDGDKLFTLKSVACDINARNFESVIVLDPHSDVTPALIDRCRIVRPVDIMRFHFPNGGGYGAVIAPDAGAAKRAGAVAEWLDVPLVVASKKRSTATGRIGSYSLPEFEPTFPKVLVVDDLCDGGATFAALADAIPGDIEADLYVTHGLFTRGTAHLAELYARIYTTDSVAADPDHRTFTLDTCAQLFRRPANTWRLS